MEAAFQVPLLLRFLAGVDQSGADAGGLGLAKLAAAGSYRRVEMLGCEALPEAGAGQEGVLDGSAREELEILVRERICIRRAHIFMREIDAGDAFVVGGERDRDAHFPVQHEWDARRR